ncbi:MAG TPA: peptidylprolyl isomerase [Chakrabartia sp.]|jgi:peptidylprolyl isomerase|nr:peptidylprolyl isomerase [Chakrabartia sp.]
MKRIALVPVAALLMGAREPAAPAKRGLSPGEIVATAPAADWAAIASSDLMVMDLAPLGGKPRRVVIQLMPAPFSQGWVSNIRKLVAARWYDGVSVNRVQDNYVVQWGDASEKKPLPDGLAVVEENHYALDLLGSEILKNTLDRKGEETRYTLFTQDVPGSPKVSFALAFGNAPQGWFKLGWPISVGVRAISGNNRESFPGPVDVAWPVHCYGMVGVGRGMPPDTGTGAELYTVIGHAPRHLDRNIALVGRVIEGIEHLSSLPRGPGAMGFYEHAEDRVPILSVRMGNEVEGLPRYHYLSTDSTSFAAYADARANRRDPFFIRPAGGADICNIPVPVRRVP